MKRLIIKLVHKYQKSKGSNHIPSCIFTPSCSDYAILALEKYNIFKALRLIKTRIYKCDSAKNIGGEDYP
jgi:uncharacterized protein